MENKNDKNSAKASEKLMVRALDYNIIFNAGYQIT
jgi:hypothetical protein